MRQTLLLLGVLTLTACATATTATTSSNDCRPPEFAAAMQTLYFGTERAGADAVTQSQWLGFLEHEVTPAFPEGLTWWTANGQWRDPEAELVVEKSFVLQLLHRDEAEEQRKIAILIESYRKQFAQKAVLSTRRVVCASF
jgi:hypothetical protein